MGNHNRIMRTFLSSNFNLQLLITLLILCGSLTAAGQEIKVVDFSIIPNDKTAEEHPRLDLNDEPCALVKIKTNGIKNLNFPNKIQYMGDIEFKDDTYYLYIPTITSKISFAHDDYLPGTIDLADFGYKKNVKGGKTYQARLEAPSSSAAASGISFKVSPYRPGCSVRIDGKEYAIPGPDVLKVDCSNGTHSYVVTAPNYKEVRGSANVSGTYVPVHVTLRPLTVEMDFITTPSNSEVYIDDVNYGKSGRLSVPLGEHYIRITSKGYLDYTDTLNITNDMAPLTVNLQKNKGQVIDIHPVGVKIICNTDVLYKNNKKIDGWRTGDTVYFMPGTSCRLSDDYGNGAILRVGNSPMTITMENGTITIVDNK